MKINHLRGRRFIVVFALLGALAAAAVFGMTASAAKAAAAKTTVRFTAHSSVVITKLSGASQLPASGSFVASDAFIACQGDTPLQPTGPCPLHPPSDGGALPLASKVPHAKKVHKFGGNAGPALGANFLGITDISQRVFTGHHFTPPDQGLCVGPAGPLEGAGVSLGVDPTTTVVTEMTNDGWAVFDTSGNMLFADSNADLFSDANSSGDPECNYDAASQTYFFTEIGAPNNQYYTTNLAVLNAAGYTPYNIDTATLNGITGWCFPDFPHQGLDSKAWYLSINEFCGANEDYTASAIYAVDKAALVAHANPNAAVWTLGLNYFTMRPSTGSTKTEYLLGSDQQYASASDLDLAWVTGDGKLASGGTPTLSVTSIPSEAYSEPVPAQSTGDDTTCVHNFGTWCSVPEKTLDPVDMRLEQVTYSHGLLYTDLSTSLTVGKDPTVVDGVAWFVVDPNAQKVVQQSYLGIAGTYLLDPSFVMSKWDKKGVASHYIISFSMTSPTLNPSAGFVVSTNSGAYFSPIATTGVGSGPHVSFSTTEPGYMRRRWGDYSRIAIDPATGDVWSADEYIPSGAAGADQIDNWGTQVWQLSK